MSKGTYIIEMLLQRARLLLRRCDRETAYMTFRFGNLLLLLNDGFMSLNVIQLYGACVSTVVTVFG